MTSMSSLSAAAHEWLFFAPRSNETSSENFAATLASGYPIEKVEEYLDQREKLIIGSRRKLYIWGNALGKKGSWNKLKLGDFVAFYVKGEFVYVGKCILKKHSPEIARKLWGNVKKKNFTWEYLFFLDELRPVSIPFEILKEFGGYKEKMVVQGFMPLNELGMGNLLGSYGSIAAFFDNYTPGLSSKDISVLDRVASKEIVNAKDIEAVDAITREKDLDLLLLEWEQRKSGEAPTVVEKKVKAIKRNATLVRQMKSRLKDECQVCGFTFLQKNGNYYSEVAHIEPISSKKMGVDKPSNLLVLCPNHHKMLDRGNLSIVSKNQYSIDGKIFDLKTPMIALEYIQQ